jgi:tRNA(Arg) A34 adenosine deaminase TadA
MDIFQPKQISGECHVKNYVGNVFDYLDGKRKKTDSVTVQNYIDTVELAGLSVLTGNRGVGAVLLRGKELVGTGQNNVSEPDNHLKHVGHAEVNAITDYNTPDGDELPPEEKADLELVSSIGPCCMCLIAAIGCGECRRQRFYHALARDAALCLQFVEGCVQCLEIEECHIDCVAIRLSALKNPAQGRI